MTVTVSANQAPYKKHTRSKKRKISPEDRDVAKILEQLKTDLDFLYNSFDHVTDPILIDGYIYEIMALQMKYKYYLRLCKNRGLYGEEETVE